MDWSAVDVFISSHSDGTHSLQSIHCWDTDAETHFYKPDEETNLIVGVKCAVFVRFGHYSYSDLIDLTLDPICLSDIKPHLWA